MKSKLLALAASSVAITAASAADGLYYIGSEAQESLPLKWVVGLNATYDDNVTPTAPVGAGQNDEAFSLNPYVGVSFVNMTPQSTLDVYAKVGALFYLDSPVALGADDVFPQARVGVNWTHRFSERLRLSSRNFVAYELEPEYSFGYATTRQLDAYLYWQTDNSIGYRWTERLATYTGFQLTGLNYDSTVTSSDRFTITLYQQFRYQLSPQSVLTGEYRYADTTANDLAPDTQSHYFLAGIEHRFSPNTILVARAGAQVYETDAANGADGTSPYVELAVRSRVNEAFSLRGFARYGVEVYDTVRAVGASTYNFDERTTLRIGLSGEYVLSPMLTLFSGLDYIPASFDDGRRVAGAGPLTVGGLDEDVWNAYIGLSVKFTEYLYGTLSYNYTDSSSDFAGLSYDRNRISIGVRAEF
ncbi:MAG: hypothetical protein MUF31_00615 [Akkermansiaceae bacterium]|jgi:hypothetical protein|nr:hypothetical protein [Akkermansiaceae bacterium]